MPAQGTSTSAVKKTVDLAYDPAVIAWAELRGYRTQGGVDRGHVEAYLAEQERAESAS